jgi:hypothetical protein
VQQEDVELEEILITQGEAARDKRSLELQNREWKRIDKEKQEIARARQIVEAARRNGREWPSSKLKEHYQKVWAEATAKEQADREELAALRAAAAAEAGKKPSATASGEDEQTDRGTGTNNGGS